MTFFIPKAISIVTNNFIPFVKKGSWLIKPHPSIKDVGDCRINQLTAGFTLTLGIASILGFIVSSALRGNEQPITKSLFINIVISFIGFFLSRTHLHRFAPVLLVLDYSISGFFLAISSEDQVVTFVTSVTWSLFLGSVLLSTRGIAIFTAAITVLTYVTPKLILEMPERNLGIVAVFFLLSGITSLIIKLFRITIERERLRSISTSNQELQALKEKLEERLQERSLELTIDSELGQILSMARERNVFLSQAVNLIQERLNLYYAQIFLTDPQERFLVLEAGSGRVGELLRQRNHRLPIDTNSINGKAALEKSTVIVPETSSSSNFKHNPLLPETLSEMCIPLIFGERVVGILDLQSNQPCFFKEERLHGFTSVARQLAVAIDNAVLYEQAFQSTRAMHDQAKHLTREGWQEYLNAIDRQEHLGAIYTPSFYDSQNVSSSTVQENIKNFPIAVAGVTIGAIELAHDSNQTWRVDEIELTQAVAEQVGRQVENLRLLAQAERFRLEAERSARQSIHDGWQSFIRTDGEDQVVFVYEDGKVSQQQGSFSLGDSGMVVNEKLKVGDVIVGELAVSGFEEIDQDTKELITNVSERLSAHLENLRLANATQKALAKSEQQARNLALLNDLATQLGAASVLSDILNISGRHSQKIMGAEYSCLAILNSEFEVDLYTVEGDEGEGTPLVNEKKPLNGNLFGEVISRRREIVLTDKDLLHDSEFQDVKTKTALGIKSFISAPLVVSNKVVGSLNIGSSRNSFNENERSLFNQIVLLISNALENRSLLERTQSLAQRERILRQITSRVRSYTDPETILRTAARELGSAVGRKVLIQLGRRESDEEKR